jgi:thiamine-monophosphate kinase
LSAKARSSEGGAGFARDGRSAKARSSEGGAGFARDGRSAKARSTEGGAGFARDGRSAKARSSEGELVAAFLAPFSAGERVVIGPGSDCAAVGVARGQKLVSTTDALIEGVHFDWRWFSAEQVGHKALAVNLSDLAAAGATPRWFLCALGMPPRQAERASGIARGMARLARRHGCALVGGNVSAARDWSITITALGEAPQPRSRIGARPGDALFVCGKLGAAAAGLRMLRGARGAAPGSAAAMRAQRMPSPLVEAGLAARRFASCAIDVSDGFLRDLSRLCAASGVGAEVDCDALPVGPGASLEDALSGGEDYALLFAIPKHRSPGFRSALRAFPASPSFEVGRFSEAQGLRLSERGRPRALPTVTGFDHLS